MKVCRELAIGVIVASLLGLGAAPLCAQQESEEKPKPAARVLMPLPDLSGDQQNTDQKEQTMEPDRGPVSGVQNPTLGTSELRHSYWVPGVQYGMTAQSNNFNNTGATQNPG